MIAKLWAWLLGLFGAGKAKPDGGGGPGEEALPK
jgi:hypothetical protein